MKKVDELKQFEAHLETLSWNELIELVQELEVNKLKVCKMGIRSEYELACDKLYLTENEIVRRQ